MSSLLETLTELYGMQITCMVKQCLKNYLQEITNSKL
jgi:hypothetical protein